MLPLQILYGLLMFIVCQKDFTGDLALASVCLDYVAGVTVTLVRAWSVVAQLTAHPWTLTLINISTGQSVFHELKSCCTATSLHSKNQVLVRDTATFN